MRFSILRPYRLLFTRPCRQLPKQPLIHQCRNNTQAPTGLNYSNGPGPSRKGAQGDGKIKPLQAQVFLENYCYYRDTAIPQQSQLETALKFFFSKKPPEHLWASHIFRTIPESSLPEVAFLGRSNVGKSSLVNALVGSKLLASSSKPGRTKIMTSIGVGKPFPKIALIDTPGYGKASRTEWGVEIAKYLEKRKQLRRIFLLIDASVGLKSSDIEVLSLLRRLAVPYQIVLTKVDRAVPISVKNLIGSDLKPQLEQFRETVRGILSAAQPDNPTLDGPGPLGEVISCGMEVTSKNKPMLLGLSAVQWAILVATGHDQVNSDIAHGHHDTQKAI